jgi:hypothetical protein
MGDLLPIRTSGRGRQSAIVEELRDQRDELTAAIAEGAELAARIVTLARTAQVRLVRGVSPADLLDELERVGLRHASRMTAAAAAMGADDICPDGAEERHSGHGRAA